jgi:hypothetical protein
MPERRSLYRFRTPTETGPWVGSHKEALQGAVEAGGARWEAEGACFVYPLTAIDRKDADAA